MSVAINIINSKHDLDICEIIKTVGKEFGAVGEGFGPSDPEVEAMSLHYNDAQGSCYLVASIDDTIIGGCGIASFNGSDSICELRKLFLLPSCRGLGLGKKLTQQCLDYAKNKGYNRCYLDTLASMTSAISLYEKMGFVHLKSPLAGTIHDGCDVWMMNKFNE